MISLKNENLCIDYVLYFMFFVVLKIYYSFYQQSCFYWRAAMVYWLI